MRDELADVRVVLEPKTYGRGGDVVALRADQPGYLKQRPDYTHVRVRKTTVGRVRVVAVVTHKGTRRGSASGPPHVDRRQVVHDGCVYVRIRKAG